MMNPGAIMSNMMAQGQLMGDGMERQAIAAEQRAGGVGPQPRAIKGRAGGGAQAQQALVPSGGGAASLLDLFNTPHGYGGGGGGVA